MFFIFWLMPLNFLRGIFISGGVFYRLKNQMCAEVGKNSFFMSASVFFRGSCWV
jgi:hypothetical protein